MKCNERNIVTSRFFCTQCGKETISIARTKSKQREGGHLKKLYCLNCKKENNCVEIRGLFDDYNIEDFNFEFTNNNFTKEGQRKLSYNELVKEVEKESVGKFNYNDWMSAEVVKVHI